VKLFKDKKSFYFLLGRILFRYGIIFLIASWVVWDYSFSSSKILFNATVFDKECIAEITTGSLTLKVGDTFDMFVTQDEHQLLLFGKKY